MATKQWTVGTTTFQSDDQYWSLELTRDLPSFLPTPVVVSGIHVLCPPHILNDPSDAYMVSETPNFDIYMNYLTYGRDGWKTVLVHFGPTGNDYRTINFPLDFNFIIDVLTVRSAETLDDYKSDWISMSVSYLVPEPFPVFYIFTLVRFYEPPPEFMKNKFVLVVQLVPLDPSLPTKSYTITGILENLLNFPMWCWYPIVPTRRGVLFPLSSSFQMTGGSFTRSSYTLDTDSDYLMAFLYWSNPNTQPILDTWTFSYQFIPYLFSGHRILSLMKGDEKVRVFSHQSQVFREFDPQTVSWSTVSAGGTEIIPIDRLSFGVLDYPYGYYGDVRSLYTTQSGKGRLSPNYIFPYVQVGYPYYISRVRGLILTKDLSNNPMVRDATVPDELTTLLRTFLYPSGTEYTLDRVGPPLWLTSHEDLLFVVFGKSIGPVLPFSPHTSTSQGYLTPLVVLPNNQNVPFFLPLQPLIPLRPLDALAWMMRTESVRVGHPVHIPGSDTYIPVFVPTGTETSGSIGLFKFNRVGNVPLRVRDLSVNYSSDGKMVIEFVPPPTGRNRIAYFIVEQILQPENPIFTGNPQAVLSHSLFNYRDWEIDFYGDGNFRPFEGTIQKLSFDHPPKKVRVKTSLPQLSGQVRVLTVLRKIS